MKQGEIDNLVAMFNPMIVDRAYRSTGKTRWSSARSITAHEFASLKRAETPKEQLSKDIKIREESELFVVQAVCIVW